ncbi:MAG TPA: hypothetical protein VMF89_00290 [Polyangiales bacterium]|nr:hypothetical protein [Polyangiales bacterium]
MRYALVSLLFSLSAAACSGDAEEHDAQAQEELEDDFKGCPADVPVFSPGLQVEDAERKITLISAQPTEPERYENDWVVEVIPPEAVIVRGQTFMPIHGHDGRVEPIVKPMSTPGQFAIERLNFTMRGPWEVRLWLSSAAATEERLVFQVCVAK